MNKPIQQLTKKEFKQHHKKVFREDGAYGDKNLRRILGKKWFKQFLETEKNL